MVIVVLLGKRESMTSCYCLSTPKNINRHCSVVNWWKEIGKVTCNGLASHPRVLFKTSCRLRPFIKHPHSLSLCLTRFLLVHRLFNRQRKWTDRGFALYIKSCHPLSLLITNVLKGHCRAIWQLYKNQDRRCLRTVN